MEEGFEDLPEDQPEAAPENQENSDNKPNDKEEKQPKPGPQDKKPKPSPEGKKPQGTDPMTQLAEILQDFVKGVNKSITDAANAPFKKAWELVKNTESMQNFMEKVEEKKVDAANMTKEFTDAVKDGVKDVMKSGASGLADGLKIIGESIKEFGSKAIVAMKSPSDSASADEPVAKAGKDVTENASMANEQDNADMNHGRSTNDVEEEMENDNTPTPS